MEFIADLHLHSKYSRAVSQQMVLPEMAKWGAKKGINLLTTGDWTHPLWLRSIKGELEEAGEGVYKLKSQISNLKSQISNDVRFILTTEIASVYKQGEKLRRIHNLVFAPNLETAEKINKALIGRGCNLGSDGRPIIGLSSKNLLELLLNIDKKIILIPCHAWTPHFGIYGSASGFDSIKESFEDLSNYIYGIETGISSDPWMNWQIPELNNRAILSFSDAHSLPKMGRELTVFEIEKSLDTLTYTDIGKAIVSQMKMENRKWKIENGARIAYTIEFYPEEGKYHYTGHRNCKVIKSPQQIKESGDVCPVCSRRLTEGVMYRVQQLAKKGSDFKPYDSHTDSKGVLWIDDPRKIHPAFVKLVPLNEIIAESIGSPVGSEKVKIKFDEMCLEFQSELNILLKTPSSDIVSKFGEKIAEGVAKVRKGDIIIEPGYDGEYGKVKIWNEKLTAEALSIAQETQLGIKF
ncbi:MAG: hypothetical protein A3B47_01495 [Candidatus Levybacteria bacterium RIFCSPLOWO2_01_FULL_39_24]|nr:MAG: hypothetical protein A2800_00085 [Candidatus Levybacteria bacterium RIFCSPHIGHO2_01_FULL_40_16]OGH27818.1 MAG: hypothetical protein A3E12_00430 [Candidatus Levybacteria bacterium RIFCSPHIGHO2_12_FULL_39_9]OGH46093.1 MAG: hypothetical protein A3B47_01495 [Candidatus Levybacteria bacterium RIFCSPLOWO2_01_FULL_39_24]